MTLRGLFVTGTDTGVGKTVLAGAVLAGLRERDASVAALKPVITGLDEAPDPDWPHDHELLALAAGRERGAERVAVAKYGPAVSPHLAAELSGQRVEPAALTAAVRAAADANEIVIVEGVGGLLVPLADGYDVRALALELGLPLVIAARPGLGTINHTLLTLEAARAVGLRVAAVVLTPWPPRPTELERSNRDTIVALGRVAVSSLPPIPSADPTMLAAAGRQLPLERWLAD